MKKYFDFIWICVWSIVLAASPVYGGPNDNLKLSLICKVWEIPPLNTMTCNYYRDVPGNVEICDSPLLSNITKCMSQPVENWSNEIINITLNLKGNLAGYEKGYFYVTDVWGITETEGFPFIFADYDGDGDVDGLDIYKLASNFNGDVVSLQSLAGGSGK